MPTQDETSTLPPLVRTVANATATLSHTTCPPEDDSSQGLTQTFDDQRMVSSTAPSSGSDQIESHSRQGELTPVDSSSFPNTSINNRREQDHVTVVRNETTHVSGTEEQENETNDGSVKSVQTLSNTALYPPLARGMDQPSLSNMPRHTSSFLKHGSTFVGTQHSDRQVYNVSVELKHVDMRESFLCGYLRIEGLTDAHPTLTTYFEGEIIGNKYTFQTRHDEWGSNIKIDMQHWNRFPAWRPLARAAQHSDFSFRNYAEREHLFMRWKEYFLVPDHRVRSISGASFEGFYYICFNQVLGTVSGIYFHSKSEKFQQLEMKHVHDYGSKTALDFA